MRITNRIMQNNAMYNINQNKIKEDKYNTQMATNKKINRASEDPIVAIRALRLRSNVSELTQYYEKNSKDAESWLKVTEDSLSTVTELLTSAIAQANKGANKELTSTDLSAIITEMTELSDEYYATGNVDYGGRYVFTGYRTDTPLTFTDKVSQEYTGIHDGFNAADIDEIVHISGVSGIEANAASATSEADIDRQELGRIRLSYDKLKESTDADATADSVKLKYRESFTVPATSNIVDQHDNGNPKTVKVTFKDGGAEKTITVTLPQVVKEESKDLVADGLGTIDDGNYTLSANSDGTFCIRTKSATANPAQVINLGVNGSVHSSYNENTIDMQKPAIMTTTSPADADTIYQNIASATGEGAWLNTDTGEILFSDKLRERLSSLPNLINADTIEVIYDKSQWEKGDIRPENLFECTTPNPNSTTANPLPDIHYNGGTYGHTMSYDVGYSQKVDVNTQACDVFTTDVKRSMDDLNASLKNLETLEKTMEQIKKHLDEADDTTRPGLQAEYAAAEKAQSYLRQDIQDQLEHKITQLQRALDVANLAVTQNGMRSRRLELIQNRLQNQVTTFKTLQSDNEDIDMAETATNLMTAQTIYNASLQATGKISQNSLLDYV